MKMKMKMKQPCNINDEYLCALRTKSFADFFVKAQLLVSEEPTPCHLAFSEILLNPPQETIQSLLQESSLLSSSLKPLLLDYFNISAEASHLCTHLLKSLIQLQSNYRFIDADSSPQLMISDLRARLTLDNPFSDLNEQDFKHIHDKHSSVLHQLKSTRKRVARKIKMIKFFNKAWDVSVTAACGVVAAAAAFLAVHTLTALLIGPAIFSLPMKRKMRRSRFLKCGFMRKVVEQLDVAAKGAYILNRDFDTIGRLVARIQDEIEHNRAMIHFFLERREDRHCLQMLEELKRYEFGVSKQAEELEEHVYLCLLTINRARAMVVREICTKNHCSSYLL